MKKYISLVPGLLCLGVGVFLAYGLQYVTENWAWYIGYMVVAFVVGLLITCLSARELRHFGRKVE